jgi:hypothetical protein
MSDALIYVPGVFRCPKCNFRLIQSNLNAQDGTVTPRDAPGDKCPNDGSPMWRVTYRDELAEAYRICEQQVARAVDAETRASAQDELVERLTKDRDRWQGIAGARLVELQDRLDDITRLTEERDALVEAVERARRHADNIGITAGSYIAQLNAALAKIKGGERATDDPEYSGYCEVMGDEVVPNDIDREDGTPDAR